MKKPKEKQYKGQENFEVSLEFWVLNHTNPPAPRYLQGNLPFPAI
jgi:hypothetical protein